MMIDHDQKDETISSNTTSFTVIVARANSAHIEKSISCARARVSVSISLLFLPAASCGAFGGKLTEFSDEANRYGITTRETADQCNISRRLAGNRTGCPVSDKATSVTCEVKTTSPSRVTSCCNTIRAPVT